MKWSEKGVRGRARGGAGGGVRGGVGLGKGGGVLVAASYSISVCMLLACSRRKSFLNFSPF